MKPFGYLLVFFFGVTLAHGTESLAHEKENSPFWVHGRLSPWNGNPTFRIWIVGTKRILGVRETMKPTPDHSWMPKELYDIFLSQPDVFGTEVYADFLVEPLATDEQGCMRPVRIIEAKKLVVTYGDKIQVRQERIQPDTARSSATKTTSTFNP